MLMEGEIDESVRLLQSELTTHPGDGESELLLCRAYFAEQRIDASVNHCEAAVKALPSQSSAHDWMGRAYGMKASGAGPIGGLRLARQVRAEFESAVALDPRSADAANDLAEFYVNAPALVGGGIDKANQLADRVANDLPQTAHRIRALVAVKRKDYATAEQEFRAAVAVKGSPAAWVDLGGFYQGRRRTNDAVAALRQAIASDSAKDSSLVDAASYLMDMHVQPEMAMNALREYLSGGSRSDKAPVVWVHILLGRLQQASGNKDAARYEYEKSLQLATDYSPAVRALQTL